MIKTDASKAIASLKYLIKQFENSVETGLTVAAEDGATKAKNDTIYTPRTGNLQANTNAQNTGYMSRSIVANTFYASWVNFGNGEPGARIYPTHAKALRFEINGQVIFRKSVKTSTPKPFMTNTAKWEETHLEDAVAREINRLLGRL
jgi:hypothetical protein